MGFVIFAWLPYSALFHSLSRRVHWCFVFFMLYYSYFLRVSATFPVLSWLPSLLSMFSNFFSSLCRKIDLYFDIVVFSFEFQTVPKRFLMILLSRSLSGARYIENWPHEKRTETISKQLRQFFLSLSLSIGSGFHFHFNYLSSLARSCSHLK